MYFIKLPSGTYVNLEHVVEIGYDDYDPPNLIIYYDNDDDTTVRGEDIPVLLEKMDLICIRSS